MIFKQNNLIGLILIAVGAMALLGNIGILGDMPTTIFSLGMGAGGVYLIRSFLKDPKQIWASIVGFAFLGLALAAITTAMSGFYFLGMLGLGFTLIYQLQHKHWWTLIPGGALLTLAFVAASEVVFPRWDAGPLFFTGLAATFGYLYINVHKKWAVYPAMALLIMAILGLSVTGGWILPILLIGAGMYALNRKSQSSQRQRQTVQSTQVQPVNVPTVTEYPITKYSVIETLEASDTKKTITELEDMLEASSDMNSEGNLQTKAESQGETKV